MITQSDMLSRQISKISADITPADTEKNPGEIQIIHDISDLYEETPSDSAYGDAIVASKDREYKKLALQDRLADLKAIPLGAALFMGNKVLGPNVLVHEYGHLYTDKLMYNNCTGVVQVDAVENFKMFMQKPSVDSFQKLVLENDINGNHNRGYYMPMGRGDAREFVKDLTTDQREMIIDAGGSIVESIPSFAAFTAGFMLRKKHPLMGYTLMTFGALSHMRSSLYPLVAVLPNVQALGGNDWVNVSKYSGLHPAITASLFAASLPLLALGLYSIEKMGEGRTKERIALANLIGDQRIAPEELRRAYDEYNDKDRLSMAEEKACEVFTACSGKHDESLLKDSQKAEKSLEKEYGRFSDYLIERYEERIKKELPHVEKELPKMSIPSMLNNSKESIKASWKNDKPGTLLNAGSMVASTAVLGASTLVTAGDILCTARGITPETFPDISRLITNVTGSLSKALTVAIPVAGIAGLASTCYSTNKILNNKTATDADKVASVSSTVFAGIGTAGLFIPAIGMPLIMLGTAGQIGTWAGKIIYDHIEVKDKQKTPAGR